MGFREELAEQARVLDALLSKESGCICISESMDISSFDSVVFAGMGSSYYAGIYGAVLFNRVGIKAVALEASELSHYHRSLLDDSTLLIAISQSGESTETMELVRSIKGRNTMVMTNRPQGELGCLADIGVVDIMAGEEKATSTKTYTNTLGTIVLLARYAFGIGFSGWEEGVGDALALMRTWLSRAEDLGREISDFFSGIRYLVYMGSGLSQANALHAALITGEMSGEMATATTVGQFFHGLIEQVDHRYGVIALGGSSLPSPVFQQACFEVVKAGGRLVSIGSTIDCADFMEGEKQKYFHLAASLPADVYACWAEIVPVECFAYMWSLAKGREPGVLHRVQKK